MRAESRKLSSIIIDGYSETGSLSWADAYLTDPCDCPSHDIDSHVSIFAWKWIWTFLAVVYLSVKLSYLNHKEQGTSFAMCKKCLVVPKIFLKPAWILILLTYFSLPLCSVCFITLLTVTRQMGSIVGFSKIPSPLVRTKSRLSSRWRTPLK